MNVPHLSGPGRPLPRPPPHQTHFPCHVDWGAAQADLGGALAEVGPIGVPVVEPEGRRPVGHVYHP